MDLNLPWIQESFNAKFTSADRKGLKSDEKWSFELPLIVEERFIGRIDLEAEAKSDFAKVLVELNNILISLDDYFIETIGTSINAPLNQVGEDTEQTVAERQSIEFGENLDGNRSIDAG